MPETKTKSRGPLALIAGLLIAIIILANIVAKQKPDEAAATALGSTATDTTTSIYANHLDTGSTHENKVDPATVKTLSKFVTFKKDEFQGLTWVQPKSRASYKSDIYCYFAKEGDRPTNFRLYIRYYADEWLFIKHYEFLIECEHYDYYPEKVNTDNGSGSIWEWSDQHVGADDTRLIMALASAKSAKMRMVGTQYTKDKPLTAGQLKSIKDMVSLYQAMGGAL